MGADEQRLLSLQDRFKTAPPSERAAIRAEYRELHAQWMQGKRVQ